MTMQVKADWFKSSYSNGTGGCVETTRTLLGDGLAPVRDSKLAVSPVLGLGVTAFSRLVEYAKHQTV
jgi:hypothetical protein